MSHPNQVAEASRPRQCLRQDRLSRRYLRLRSATKSALLDSQTPSTHLSPDLLPNLISPLQRKVHCQLQLLALLLPLRTPSRGITALHTQDRIITRLIPRPLPPLRPLCLPTE
jgi:hypothetical protein